MGTIHLQPYQADWRTTADCYQQTFQDATWYRDSSHVGSTAMPQLLARPVIDVGVLTTDSTATATDLGLTSIAGRGTVYRGQFNDQPVQVLVTTDEATYQHWLNFRDYLNAHRTDGRKYTAIRQTAAKNAATYEQTRADFMASIQDKANDWRSNQDQHEHHDRTVRAELVNMCLITNPATGEVVVEDKIDAQWTGLTFPGGHVDRGEPQVAAMKREVLEETGLTVHSLKIAGTVTWVENDAGDVSLGTLYTTDDYSGDLLAGSYEGAISWQPLSSLTPERLAPGVDKILTVFTDPNATEAFWGFDDTQLRVY